MPMPNALLLFSSSLNGSRSYNWLSFFLLHYIKAYTCWANGTHCSCLGLGRLLGLSVCPANGTAASTWLPVAISRSLSFGFNFSQLAPFTTQCLLWHNSLGAHHHTQSLLPPPPPPVTSVMCLTPMPIGVCQFFSLGHEPACLKIESCLSACTH